MKNPNPFDICFYFDRMLLRPVKIKFLQFNKDGWLRFEYLESHSGSTYNTMGSEFGFTCCPPESWGKEYAATKLECIKYVVMRIMDFIENDKL